MTAQTEQREGGAPGGPGPGPGAEDAAEAPAPITLGQARTGVLSVWRIAKWDIIDLALVATFAFVALAVAGGILRGYLGVKAETARLEGIVKAQGGLAAVEGNLTKVEGQIAVRRGELRSLLKRVSPDLNPEVNPVAILNRISYEANSARLGVVQVPEQNQRDDRLEISPGIMIEYRRYENTVRLHGSFENVLRLLAQVESYGQLVVFRGIRVDTAPAGRGDVDATLDITSYQVGKDVRDGSR